MAEITERAVAQVVAESKEEEKLPKLSGADFRIYNRMAEHMEYFVGIFADHMTASI